MKRGTQESARFSAIAQAVHSVGVLNLMRADGKVAGACEEWCGADVAILEGDPTRLRWVLDTESTAAALVTEAGLNPAPDSLISALLGEPMTLSLELTCPTADVPTQRFLVGQAYPTASFEAALLKQEHFGQALTRRIQGLQATISSGMRALNDQTYKVTDPARNKCLCLMNATLDSVNDDLASANESAKSYSAAVAAVTAPARAVTEDMPAVPVAKAKAPKAAKGGRP